MPVRALLLALVLLVPTAAAEFGRYDETGYPVNVLGEPTFPGGILPGGALPEGPLNQAGPLTVYPYYPVLTAEMRRLAEEHPDLARLHSIGKSTAGLDLWMLEIADFARIAAGEGVPLELREVAWIDGGTHSNEYSGVYFAARLASFLLDEYETNDTARWIVENRHTWIMPLVNPDGSNLMGRLNAKTVNINRNYPVDWGALAEDPLLNNPGPAPASEVETQANIAWFNQTRPDFYASVHCCGNLWLYPYGVEGLDPVDNATLARICAEALPSVGDACGPIWSTIYPASGSSVDTVYEYTGAAAFGYEMSGRGAVALWGQPFTSESVEVQEAESWQAVLHGLLNAHLYGAYPDVAAARVDGDALVLTIQNQGYGPLTRGSVALLLGARAPAGSDAAATASNATIPPLAPGESATLRLDGPLVEGAWSLRFEYVQRIQAAPVALREAPLTLRMGADGLEVVGAAGEILPLATQGAPVPAAPLGLVLAALVALGLLRRR